MAIDRFGVLGWSGGGVHTTVCGYALTDRLTFNITLCGYTNFAELPGAAEMLSMKADQISVKLSQKNPRLFQVFFDLMAFSFKYFPETFYKQLAKVGNSSDKNIVADPGFKVQLIADQKEAMIQGGKGVMVDAAVLYADWGFRLEEITGKIHIFHGTEDTIVPVAFVKHLSENLPNCELHLLERQGYLFPVDHQELIFMTAKSEI